MAEIDPFTLEVIKNRLASIADDMALTVARTARSFIVKEALDYSTALFGANSEFIAQGTCLPLHLGSMPSALNAVLKQFGDDIAPGDIFALNDPYDGGTHLPDIIAVLPVFVDGALVGYSACIAHQIDMGGRVPGSMACDSTEIYQEGLRLPPLRLYRAGVPEETVFRIIERNVRMPETVLGDINSQIAACRIGERGLTELVDRYGREGFENYREALLDYTERRTRAEIAKLPDGDYSFSDFIDGDGFDSGVITIQVKITVADEDMTIDFAGTSPQVRGAINSVYSFTASAAWACIRSVFDLNIPNNAGYFRPIRILTPERSIVNPSAPAPVAARGLTADRVADAVFGALAQLAPHRVPACGPHAPDTTVSFGGYYADGKPFVYLEGLVGSWGGGPDRDGMDASTGTIVNYSNTPAEMLEVDQPLMIERYGLVPDSGGAGKYRGGLAVVRHIRFLSDEAVLQVRTDRHQNAPYGLEGGEKGAHAGLRLIRADGSHEDFFGPFLVNVQKGDMLQVNLPSGGGFGDPLERDPAHVLRDVAEGKVSVKHAAAAYGVVIDDQISGVRQAETEALRASRR